MSLPDRALFRASGRLGTLAMVANGGIRRGTDIVKAIALGATAVRAAWWPLTVWRRDGGGTDNITTIVARAVPKELPRA